MNSRKPFPGFDGFFELHDPLANPPFRGTSSVPIDSLDQIVRGEMQPVRPIEIYHAMGGRPFDFIWLTSVSKPIVSDRVVNLLCEGNFTGWATYPVTVYGENGSVIPGYSGLAITGRCGPFDWTRGRREMRQMPGGLFPYYVGHYFDAESWDDSDFFVSTSGDRTICAVERVKNVLARAKVRNVRWVRLTDAEINGYLVEKRMGR